MTKKIWLTLFAGVCFWIACYADELLTTEVVHGQSTEVARVGVADANGPRTDSDDEGFAFGQTGRHANDRLQQAEDNRGDQAAGETGVETNEDTALALARIWVSENGFRRESDDQTAILTVLRDRARRMDVDLLTAMQRYCPRSFGGGQNQYPVARRWIANLRVDSGQPVGWNPRIRWSRYEGIWSAMLVRARLSLSDSDVSHSCKKAPQHWAARSFERPRLLGWEEVDCGDTSNAFWIRRYSREVYERAGAR